MDSQDARNPFEPRVDDAYTYYDPITGSRDRTGDESLRRKIAVVSSIDAGTALLGNARGTIFISDFSSLRVYTDDGSYKSATLS